MELCDDWSDLEVCSVEVGWCFGSKFLIYWELLLVVVDCCCIVVKMLVEVLVDLNFVVCGVFDWKLNIVGKEV